ncbi:MAG: glycosyltransferase [Arcticibacter sp.]
MNKTIAIVLTYNRLSLLKECINCLRGQTLAVDHILVVDNASTDGTGEWLAGQSDLQVLTMPENLGGSGGFKKAISTAYELNFDWIWILDDDAFPEKNCLRILKEAAARKGDKNFVLAPLVIQGDRVDHEHRGFVNFKKIQFPLQINTSERLVRNAGPEMQITFASFIGMFISREIVADVKFPDSSYYIFQEDLEYSIRIVKAGYPIFLVKNAAVHHKEKGTLPVEYFTEKRDVPVTPAKARRTILQFLEDKRTKYRDRTRIKPTLFISKRNWIWTIMQHDGMSLPLAAYLVKDIARAMSYVLLSKSNNRLLLSLFTATYLQGLTGKLNNQQFLNKK